MDSRASLGVEYAVNARHRFVAKCDYLKGTIEQCIELGDDRWRRDHLKGIGHVLQARYGRKTGWWADQLSVDLVRHHRLVRVSLGNAAFRSGSAACLTISCMSHLRSTLALESECGYAKGCDRVAAPESGLAQRTSLSPATCKRGRILLRSGPEHISS